jgi:DNA invertase Pin-like site-specific DNA recombinase
MVIGYARVSTLDQSSDLQVDALTAAGCDKIFTDKISGTVSARPGLDNAKAMLRSGDTLIVWRLDRLGRSIKDLITWSEYLEKNGIGLKSLHENIDTSTASGRLIFNVFAALADFERCLTIERTRAGLASSRARGKQGGRPKVLNTDKRKLVVDLYNKKELSVNKICDMMGITKPTLYKYLKESA